MLLDIMNLGAFVAIIIIGLGYIMIAISAFWGGLKLIRATIAGASGRSLAFYMSVVMTARIVFFLVYQ